MSASSIELEYPKISYTNSCVSAPLVLPKNIRLLDRDYPYLSKDLIDNTTILKIKNVKEKNEGKEDTYVR